MRVSWLLSTFISPANLQPWRSEPRRSQARVLQEIHPPNLLAWTHSSSSPTFPENRRHFPAHSAWKRARNTSSPQAVHRFHRELSSPSQPRSWPVRLVTSEPCRRSFASGGPCERGPGQGLRDGPGALMDESQGGPGRGREPESFQRVEWFEFLQLRVANPWSTKASLCEIGQVMCAFRASVFLLCKMGMSTADRGES